jgi:hypothetical protein
VIETLVLEPPFSAYGIEDSSEFSLSSRKNNHNNKSALSAAPSSSLETPKQIRMVSFQGQQELTEKLNGVMLLHSFGHGMISSDKRHSKQSNRRTTKKATSSTSRNSWTISAISNPARSRRCFKEGRERQANVLLFILFGRSTIFMYQTIGKALGLAAQE